MSENKKRKKIKAKINSNPTEHMDQTKTQYTCIDTHTKKENTINSTTINIIYPLTTVDRLITILLCQLRYATCTFMYNWRPHRSEYAFCIYTHTHARTRGRGAHAHTLTRAQARKHTHTRAHKHARTHANTHASAQTRTCRQTHTHTQTQLCWIIRDHRSR